MSLRAKLALVLAALALVVAAGVGWLSYTATSNRMLSEIDRSLHSSPRFGDGDIPSLGGPPPFGGGGRPLGVEQYVLQVLDPQGARVDALSTDTVVLPIDDAEKEIASTGDGEHLRTVTASDGREFRMLTRAVHTNRGVDVAVQIGRDLSEMNRVLDDLRMRILLIGSVAVVLAALAGWLAANRLTKSLRELTEAATLVSTTGRLDIDVKATGRDEVGRLGRAFSTMLGALSRSREEQRRLVQDAGHELRTPLTSLRTNVDVLRRHSDLPTEMRSKVLADLDTEVGELSSLVEEVVAVGSGRASDEPAQNLLLSEAVTAAAGRVERRTGRQIDVLADDTVVVAQQAQLERAITNLLDNAAKFDPTGLPIAITAVNGRVAVRDHGPGIAAADLPHVFDRFYRSVDARSAPGSGLGLSIVTEVAAAHGGSTFAENDPAGGAVVGFELPPIATRP